MNQPSLLLAALLVCSIHPLDARADWPQYRGPSASGVASEAALPSSWNVETGENVRWHKKKEKEEKDARHSVID